MVGTSMLDGTRSVGISELATHDFFPKKKSAIQLLRRFMLKMLGNLVTIITSRKKYSVLISYAKSGRWKDWKDPSAPPPPPHLEIWGGGKCPPATTPPWF